VSHSVVEVKHSSDNLLCLVCAGLSVLKWYLTDPYICLGFMYLFLVVVFCNICCNCLPVKMGIFIIEISAAKNQS